MIVLRKKIRHENSMIRKTRLWSPLFLGPVVVAFAIGFVWPFIQGIYLSFCKFRLIRDAQFIGFGNYAKALEDASFRHAFWYTAAFAVVSLVIINVLAFAVAYALTQGIKGSNLYRTVFFMPNLIGGIVLGYIWSMIFDGILSRYGTSILMETKYGFWGLIILVGWQQIGYMMIIYIAGLQAVPGDMLEAAKIDGANKWQTLFRVTIPNVKLPYAFLSDGSSEPSDFLHAGAFSLPVLRILPAGSQNRSRGKGFRRCFFTAFMVKYKLGLYGKFFHMKRRRCDEKSTVYRYHPARRQPVPGCYQTEL